MTRLVHLAAAVSLLVACAEPEKKPKSAVAYGDDAEKAYIAALEEFREDDCLEASPMFRKVRKEYPFSRFAAMSELRIADCLLKQKKHAEAIQAYRQFTRFRPSHDQVPYAHFKIAQAHYAQIPSTWFLAPPAHERDLGSARDALKYLRRFMTDYPDAPRVPEAREMMKDVVTLLAKHELYVAEFYLGRDAPRAAVGRLRTLIGAYEGSSVHTKALLLLGEAQLQLRDRAEARRVFQRLVDRFPDSDQADDARDHLEDLGPAPSGEPDAAATPEREGASAEAGATPGRDQDR